MSLSDPIADMLTRIRNALRSRHEIVNVRASGVCQVKDLQSGAKQDVPLEADAASVIAAVKGILGA